MPAARPPESCPDCGDVDRRDFLKTSAGALVAASTVGPLAVRGKDSETLVKEFFQTLTPAQKRVMTFPFEHPLRHKVDNNWKITKARVGRGNFPGHPHVHTWVHVRKPRRRVI